MKRLLSIWTYVFLLCTQSCGYSQAEAKEETVIAAKDTLSYHILGSVGNGQIVINDDVDLKGGVCKLPKGMTLLFKSGVIKNGTLSGSMTKIACKGTTFDRVTIEGSWNVPYITTKMFADLSYENSLHDVVALANPKIKNRIVIEKGEYRVRAENKSATCIPICSNTDLILNGTIRLAPNDLKSYNIILAKGKNINIEGKGEIIGDKHTHTGEGGEWGMGINLKGAANATVSGLTIKDCWGDCIYVGGNSRNVLIEKCRLDHGRRQGISITKAREVTIRNCKITNVSGTNPQYAIDIEPNANDTVDHILIENVQVKDCIGGFAAYKGLKSQRTTIGDIIIKGCTITVFDKYPIRLRRSKSALVENCLINTTNERAAIYANEVKQVTIRKNTINITKGLLSSFKNTVKEIVGGKATPPIKIMKFDKKDIENNIINEK